MISFQLLHLELMVIASKFHKMDVEIQIQFVTDPIFYIVLLS